LTPAVATPVLVVTIDTLLANPSHYHNTFLGVQGHFGGGIARPACSWVGSPTDWMLASTPPDQRLPALQFLEVQNAFPEDASPLFVGARYPKHMVLHGWFRQYDGPAGCAFLDAAGNAQVDQVPHQQVWYLETIQLETDIPIEWYYPHDPTAQPYYRPTVTPAP
jgi:hypothetical protein